MPAETRESIPLQGLARLRQAAYRLFGAVLGAPDAEMVLALPSVAQALLAESRTLSTFAFWGAWTRFLRTLHGLTRSDRARLEAAYVRTFLLGPEQTLCPPYESAYGPRDAVGWVLSELEQAYAQAGFSLAPTCRDHPDHAAVELEFVGLLCGGEAEAWGQGDGGRAREQLAREARFLARHLGRWFPAFAQRVRARDDDGFYALATEAAHAFIVHEQGLIGAMLGHISSPPTCILRPHPPQVPPTAYPGLYGGSGARWQAVMQDGAASAMENTT